MNRLIIDENNAIELQGFDGLSNDAMLVMGSRIIIKNRTKEIDSFLPGEWPLILQEKHSNNQILASILSDHNPGRKINFIEIGGVFYEDSQT